MWGRLEGPDAEMKGCFEEELPDIDNNVVEDCGFPDRSSEANVAEDPNAAVGIAAAAAGGLKHVNSGFDASMVE